MGQPEILSKHRNTLRVAALVPANVTVKLKERGVPLQLSDTELFEDPGTRPCAEPMKRPSSMLQTPSMIPPGNPGYVAEEITGASDKPSPAPRPTARTNNPRMT